MTCIPMGSHLLSPCLHFTGEKTESPMGAVIYVTKGCRSPVGIEALRLSQVQRLLDIRKNPFQGEQRGNGLGLGRRTLVSDWPCDSGQLPSTPESVTKVE